MLAPKWSNLGRSWSNLTLTWLILGSSWRRFSEKPSSNFRQRHPKPPKETPKPPFSTILSSCSLDFRRFWYSLAHKIHVHAFQTLPQLVSGLLLWGYSHTQQKSVFQCKKLIRVMYHCSQYPRMPRLSHSHTNKQVKPCRHGGGVSRSHWINKHIYTCIENAHRMTGNIETYV